MYGKRRGGFGICHSPDPIVGGLAKAVADILTLPLRQYESRTHRQRSRRESHLQNSFYKIYKNIFVLFGGLEIIRMIEFDVGENDGVGAILL